MGVPLMRTKTWAYATGAFFGGIAGAFFASFKSATFPGDFYFNISVFILCMVILGGIGNIPGVIFGALFLSYLNQEGLANIGAWLNGHFGPGRRRDLHTPLDVPLYKFGIFGVILVVVMLFRPEGLIPEPAAQGRVPRRRPRPAPLRRHPRVTALLEVTQLRKEFGGLIAVDDVDFLIERACDRRASSARTARGRRPSSTCSPASTSRPPGG